MPFARSQTSQTSQTSQPPLPVGYVPSSPPSDAPATLEPRARPRKPASLRVFVPLGLALGMLFGTLWVARHRLTTRGAPAAGPPPLVTEVAAPRAAPSASVRVSGPTGASATATRR
jgi:hypothetical protein